jgi:hypothetical protein
MKIKNEKIWYGNRKNLILITRYFLEDSEKGLRIVKYENKISGVVTFQLERGNAKEIIKRRSYLSSNWLGIEQCFKDFYETAQKMIKKK